MVPEKSRIFAPSFRDKAPIGRVTKNWIINHLKTDWLWDKELVTIVRLCVPLRRVSIAMSAFPLRESFSFLKGSSWVQKLCKVIYQSVQNLLLCFKTLNLSLTGRQWSNLPSRYLPLTSAWWGYWEMDQRYPWTDHPRWRQAWIRLQAIKLFQVYSRTTKRWIVVRLEGDITGFVF